MGALEMGLKERELPDLISSWRETNPNIVQYWWNIGKAIKEETGKTFNELRQDLRLSRAADLLRQTDTPLQRIAMDLGYSDVSHFYRNFKSRYGMTPNQYRNEPS